MQTLLQDLRCRLQQLQVSRRGRHAYAHRMSRAKIAFNRGKMFCNVRFVIGSIRSPAGVAKFFIHPGNHADGSPGMQLELLDELGRLHGYHNSSAIIDGSGPEVP